jgi:hypothetical protein
MVIRPWPLVNHKRQGSDNERIASTRQRPPEARRGMATRRKLETEADLIIWRQILWQRRWLDK